MQKLRFLFFPIAFFLWYYSVFKEIDIKLAYFFNDLARFSHFIQNATAFLASKKSDFVFDAIIALFIIPYILSANREKRLERFISSLLLIGFCACCYMFWTRYFFNSCLHLKSLSPIHVLPDFFRISSVVKWIKIKEFASTSYPSGHGCTLVLFPLIVSHLMGRKLGWLALLISIPFALPRIITGAHWTSDFLLGSIPLAMFNLGWYLHTPVHTTLVQTTMRIFYGFKSLQKI